MGGRCRVYRCGSSPRGGDSWAGSTPLSHCVNSRTFPSRADRVDMPALGQARIPTQEQRCIYVRSAFLVDEPGEATEYPLIGAKVVAEAAADAQVAVELEGDAHCTPPSTGQGCAIDRSPSMSSRAYIIVDDRERCRSTSRTSSSDAPALT